MSHSLADLASALGLRLEGDGALRVRRLRHPAEAGPDDLAMAADAAHAAMLTQGAARAAVLSEGQDWRALGLSAALVSPRPRVALAGLTQKLDEAPAAEPGVHPTAIVAPDATLGDGVSVGPFSVIDAGVVLGAAARVGPHVHIGAGARIGPDALIHAGARIGWGVTIGARVILHANAVVGADGFSFVTPERGAVESAKATGTVAADARNIGLRRIHSLGAVTLGDDVEIGAGATIDRGTLVDTRIGRGTKIDNQVQIGHNVQVGEDCLLCAHVGVAGSAVIGNRVVLGGKAGVADHVRIGDDVVAGGASGIGADIRPGTVVLGSPAMPRDEALAIFLAWRRLPRLTATVRDLKKRLSESLPKG